MTNIFGIFSTMGLPYLRTPVGTLHLKDVVFLMLFFILLLDIFTRKKVPNIKSVLALPVVLILFLTLMQVLRAYFLLSEEIHYIMRLARPFFYYAFFFMLIYRIHDQKLFDQIVYAVIAIGLISALVGIAQIAFHLPLGGSKHILTQYGIQRTYQPNILFTLFGFFLLLSKRPMTSFERIVNYVYFFSTIILVLVMFSRGLWGVFLTGIAVFYLMDRTRFRIFQYGATGFIIIAILFVSAPTFLGSYSEVLMKRAQSGIKEVRQNEGTFSKRKEILGHTWQYAMESNLLTGVGYRFGRLEDVSESPLPRASIRTIQDNPYSWHGTDIGCAYIFFRYGILGIIIFGLLYFQLIRKGIKFYKTTENIYFKGVMQAILAFTVISLSLSLVAQPFTRPEMLVVLIISWYMFEFIQNREIRTNTRPIQSPGCLL